MTIAHPRSAPLPRNLLDALAAAGVDPQALALKLGIAPASLETGLAPADAHRFLEAGWRAVDDPTIGLKAGQIVKPERFGVVGIAAMSSATFGAAMERKARYWRLVWGDPYEIRTRGDEVMAILTPGGPQPAYGQARIDMELASLLGFGRRFTGVDFSPRRVTLRQARPTWDAAYAEVFGCPVLFSQPDDSIVFAREDVERPLLSRNAQVAELVAAGADAALQRMGETGLLERASRVVDDLLQGDEPSLGAVAAKLFMSERSLQRRLAAESLRFTDLLDRRREAAARRYFASDTASADDVAFLLGFATPSSFYRAFKRWTGHTPQEWRRVARA